MIFDRQWLASLMHGLHLLEFWKRHRVHCAPLQIDIVFATDKRKILRQCRCNQAFVIVRAEGAGSFFILGSLLLGLRRVTTAS
jgi:hypothetical protein